MSALDELVRQAKAGTLWLLRREVPALADHLTVSIFDSPAMIKIIEAADAETTVGILSARIAELAEARVKPLEWQFKPRSDGWYAGSAVGRYEVGVVGTTVMAILRRVEGLEDRDEVIAEVRTDKAAKAAAQADYEQRIRSALLPSPPSILNSNEPTNDS